MATRQQHKEAAYWQPGKEGRVDCLLCPQHCHISEGHLGLCQVRRNIGQRLVTLNYSRVTSAHIDPIEKKPLFHFHPGRLILSLGTLGCNLACDFCQNWNISQAQAPTDLLSPQDALHLALENPQNLGIAYTYNEPFIWYEYVLETARLIHSRGLKNVLVTNGFVEPAPLLALLPYIDAMNVDIKSMRDDFYKKLCRGTAAPPRRTVELAHRACHVEVTNLVIPGHNDTDEDFSELVDWLAGVNPNIPLHFSRYHPAYKMSQPATPASTLHRALQIAHDKLPYVYLGNIAEAGAEDTLCPACRKVVIHRSGFSVLSNHAKNGKCRFCNAAVSLVE